MDALRLVLELAFPLFLIMDPIANSAACLAILKGYSPPKQRRIIFRELLIALVLIMIFQLLGKWLLTLLGLHQSTLRVAGGIILFIISLKLIFPEDQGPVGGNDKDPFIVPIATPFIAGPSLLAAVMLYAHRETSQAILFSAVVVAWLGTLGIMLAAPSLQRVLGQRGIKAAERLMGLILILIAVQMLEEGIRLFVHSLALGAG